VGSAAQMDSHFSRRHAFKVHCHRQKIRTAPLFCIVQRAVTAPVSIRPLWLRPGPSGDPGESPSLQETRSDVDPIPAKDSFKMAYSHRHSNHRTATLHFETIKRVWKHILRILAATLKSESIFMAITSPPRYLPFTVQKVITTKTRTQTTT
jgi:hypothetical protein